MAGEQSLGFRSVARLRISGAAVTLNASSVGPVFPADERPRLATVMAGRMAAP